MGSWGPQKEGEHFWHFLGHSLPLFAISWHLLPFLDNKKTWYAICFSQPEFWRNLWRISLPSAKFQLEKMKKHQVADGSSFGIFHFSGQNFLMTAEFYEHSGRKIRLLQEVPITPGRKSRKVRSFFFEIWYARCVSSDLCPHCTKLCAHTVQKFEK